MAAPEDRWQALSRTAESGRPAKAATGGLLGAAGQLAEGPATIAYLGNSITRQRDGYRLPLHALLNERFGHEHRAINAGFGGVGSVASACTMDDMVIRHRPRLCFIETLTGDMGVGVHTDTGPALEGMVHKLGAIGASACFLHLPRQGADFSDANPVARTHFALAAHYRIPIVDLAARLSGEGSDYFRDGIHVTPEGGVRTARLIADALEPLFEVAEPELPGRPLYQVDYCGAGIAAVLPAALRDPAAGRLGRFRLRYPYLDFAADNAVRFRSEQAAVVGLFLVIGPHSDTVDINGQVHRLRDRWCSYERIHALILPRAIEPGTAIEIAPVRREDGPPTPRLKLIGLLVRPVSPPAAHRCDHAAAAAASA
jgi:hypothetical protein